MLHGLEGNIGLAFQDGAELGARCREIHFDGRHYPITLILHFSYCGEISGGAVGNLRRKRLLPRPRNPMVEVLKEGKRPTGQVWSTTSEKPVI